MRRLVVILALLAPLLIPSHQLGAAPVDAIGLLTGFATKEACSCVFVVGQTDDYCTAFGQQGGYMVPITIDHTAKTVSASFVTTMRIARAGANGCTLDPLP